MASLFDKDQYQLFRFNTCIQTQAISVPLEKVSWYLQTLKNCLLNKEQISNIQPEQDSSRLILLDQDFFSDDQKPLPKQITDCLRDRNCKLTPFSFQLTYDSYSARETVRRLLPPNCPLLPEIQILQHIAYLVLPEQLQAFKKLISQVVSDKSCSRSVVFSINGKAEVVLGDSNCEVEVWESGIKFEYDFLTDSDRWKLQVERTRFLSNIGKNQVVCDLNAGVGFLALRAAKEGHFVISNSSGQTYEYLVQNAISNKIVRNLHAFEIDGICLLEELRDQETTELDEFAATQQEYYMLKSPPIECILHKKVDHLVIWPSENFSQISNLLGFYRNYTHSWPTLHVYTQSSASEPKQDIVNKLKKVWLYQVLDQDILQFRLVFGNLYYLRVRIPQRVGFSQQEIQISEDQGGELENQPLSPLKTSMMRDLDFMKTSINDSQNMNASLLVSNLSSLLLTNSFKRTLDDDHKKRKKFIIQQNNL